jgi:hypothetical protein
MVGGGWSHTGSLSAAYSVVKKRFARSFDGQSQAGPKRENGGQAGIEENWKETRQRGSARGKRDLKSPLRPQKNRSEGRPVGKETKIGSLRLR